METKEVYIDIRKIKPEFADDQIKVRLDLISQCVGTLYPSILYDEIEKLKILKKKKDDFLTENEMEL